MKFLKDEKGMTLVEISISFLLMTIVMVISASIIMFSNNMMFRSATQDKIKMSADRIYKTIEEKVLYATNVQVKYYDTLTAANIPDVCTDPDLKYENIVAIIDGDLYAGTKTSGLENLYKLGTDETMHKDGDMKLQVLTGGPQYFNMKIKVEGAWQTDYEKDTTIQFISMLKSPAEARPTLEYVNPTGVIPVISYSTDHSTTDEMFMADPFTVDEKYVPTDWSDTDNVQIIDGAWPTNPSPEFKNGDYVIFNGELYYYLHDAQTEKHPVTAPPGTYSWWIKVNKNFDFSPVGAANSLYSIQDTIIFNNNYYMAKAKPTPSNFRPDITPSYWTVVYWFSHRQTQANREYGWSLTEFKEPAFNPDGTPVYPPESVQYDNYTRAVDTIK